MTLETEISQFLDSDVSVFDNIIQWARLLSFTETHSDDISYDQLVLLAKKSNKYRIEVNKDKIIETETIRHSGKVIIIKNTIPGLGIAEDDVVPNLNDIIKKRITKKTTCQHKTEELPA